MDFTITGLNNWLPTINSISPPAATAGGPAFELTVNGVNFVPTSFVMWNATSLSTSFINSGQLIAWVPASLIATSGNVNVTVVNPAPAGRWHLADLLFTVH